jgi:hypothetical protein
MDKRIEDLMVEAILTNHTCNEACWWAKEKVCHCSCGGKNHGCLLVDGAERPSRTSRIDGEMYGLAAVGRYADLYREAENALKALPPKVAYGSSWAFPWGATDKGAPLRLKSASKAQLKSWTELADAKLGTYLLWRKIEAVPAS